MSERSRGYSRRAVLRFGGLVAISGLLSACQSGGRPDALPPGAAATEAALGGQPAGTTELEFTTFYTGADGGIMQGLVDRYNQNQQAAKINFSAPAWGSDYLTKLQTAAMAGNPPPIVALHNYEIPPLAQFLYEIDPAALGVKKEDFVDVAWKLPMYEGKLRGLTMSTGTLGLFYNKDHFQHAGLDPARPPTNRDEFIKAA
jgi:multiple sugar transport system substrate-binding protein